MDILFLGHSLVEFFDWQKRFPDHKVLNLGIGGETVEGLLARVKRISKARVSATYMIFIMSGINNLAMDDFNFLKPYREVLEVLTSSYPEARIFVNSLLPVKVDFIKDESIRNANNALRELTIDFRKAEYLDIYRLFINENGKAISGYLLDDGVHLSSKGYEVWSGALEEIINRYRIA
jgi:lysophospholipase L1-like esterase